MILSLFRRCCIALLVLLCGCSTQFSATRSEAPGLSLKGQPLYVYSFMDLRNIELGATMVAEVSKQLGEALTAAGVPAKVLSYKETEVGRNFINVLATVQVNPGETARRNAADEARFGTRYRMVIFPSSTKTGVIKSSVVTWTIYEAATGKLVWSTTSFVKSTTLYSNDEFPQARAKAIVTGVMAELAKSQLY